MKTKEELIIQLLYTGNITLSEAFILMDMKSSENITFKKYESFNDLKSTYTSTPFWGSQTDPK